MLHHCRNHGRKVCIRCILFTIGFPVEHVIWERFPVFSSITRALGL